MFDVVAMRIKEPQGKKRIEDNQKILWNMEWGTWWRRGICGVDGNIGVRRGARRCFRLQSWNRGKGKVQGLEKFRQEVVRVQVQSFGNLGFTGLVWDEGFGVNKKARILPRTAL